MGVKSPKHHKCPQMASPIEQKAVKFISENSTIIRERQSQALGILIAPDDITAPHQGTKGADFYNDGHDSPRKGSILSSILCLLRQGST